MVKSGIRKQKLVTVSRALSGMEIFVKKVKIVVQIDSGASNISIVFVKITCTGMALSAKKSKLAPFNSILTLINRDAFANNQKQGLMGRYVSYAQKERYGKIIQVLLAYVLLAPFRLQGSAIFLTNAQERKFGLTDQNNVNALRKPFGMVRNAQIKYVIKAKYRLL